MPLPDYGFLSRFYQPRVPMIALQSLLGRQVVGQGPQSGTLASGRGGATSPFFRYGSQVGTLNPRTSLAAGTPPPSVPQPPAAVPRPTLGFPPELRMARSALGGASSLGALTNLFSNRNVVPSPVMGGVQAGQGALDLGLALAGGGSAASRATQGAGGVANLLGGGLRLFPETARSVLPSTGLLSPGPLATGLGLAASLAGIGQGLARNDKNTGRDVSIGGMGLAASGLGALGGLASLGTGAGLLYTLGPFLTAGLGPLLFGPERPSAQKRSEQEAMQSRASMVGALPNAQSTDDIARAFNAIAGRSYTGADMLNPNVLRQELQGSLFDRSAGGSLPNLGMAELARALMRVDPTGQAMRGLLPPDVQLSHVDFNVPFYAEGVHPELAQQLANARGVTVTTPEGTFSPVVNRENLAAAAAIKALTRVTPLSNEGGPGFIPTTTTYPTSEEVMAYQPPRQTPEQWQFAQDMLANAQFAGGGAQL